MIAEIGCAFAEQSPEIRLLHRRGWVFPRTRRLEWISARLDLALDVAGLAAYPAEIFEAIVVRLELRISDAPILDRQLRTTCFEKLLAVALLDMRLVDEIGDLEAEALAVPVHERAAQARSRQKARPPADRQSGLVGSVAKRHRLLDVVLHHPLADREAQLVVDCR